MGLAVEGLKRRNRRRGRDRSGGHAPRSGLGRAKSEVLLSN
jgi:hypothetical protein